MKKMFLPGVLIMSLMGVQFAFADVPTSTQETSQDTQETIVSTQEVTQESTQEVTQESTQETSQTEQAGIFSDVEATSTYNDALTYLKPRGIIQGYSDGTYKPDNQINRAEFTKIAVGLLGPETQDCAATTASFAGKFSDVETSVWYADFVCLALNNNIIAGYPDGTFKPAQNINFAEAAKIIANADMLTVTTPTGSDPWYKGYVDALAAKNAIPATIKSFDQIITRGEMAEIIFRLKAEKTDLSSQTYADLK
jgi:hypothetical protein